MESSSERTYLIFDKQVHGIGAYFRRVSFPGVKVPVYDVITIFYKGLTKGSLSTRASSIAFNFLLALGPATIFLLTLIPYLPIKDLKNEILEIMNNVIPTNSYIAIEGLIDELFQKRSGLQMFGFLVALFFAQKGVNGLIGAFNATYHNIEIRSWYQQRIISVILVGILFLLVSLAIILMFFSKLAISKLVEYNLIEVDFTYYLLLTGRWLIIIVLTFISISFLYYLAPMRKTEWHFFSAGSIFATLLTLIASVGFSYFVNNFAHFNKFFGSIGALIALMLWMNFNALTLLAGFELNASINNALKSLNSKNNNENGIDTA
ncbi:MAG: YihY/virulence factor BrkB family protein [Bacteroidales bacterium]|nr:YihY/virulence factor BrkB family protein [Bacteroidales bacterium]